MGVEYKYGPKDFAVAPLSRDEATRVNLGLQEVAEAFLSGNPKWNSRKWTVEQSGMVSTLSRLTISDQTAKKYALNSLHWSTQREEVGVK